MAAAVKNTKNKKLVPLVKKLQLVLLLCRKSQDPKFSTARRRSFKCPGLGLVQGESSLSVEEEHCHCQKAIDDVVWMFLLSLFLKVAAASLEDSTVFILLYSFNHL